MRASSDTLLVWTGAPCTNGCRTCPITPAEALPGLALAELQQALADLHSRPGRLVVLLGGEPLLRPDFMRLAAAIRAAGCSLGLVTTGRPLLYPQIRQRLQRLSLAYLRIQLFGCGASHDAITAVPGSFQQAIDGLSAWIAEAGPDCDVDVALTVRDRSVDAAAFDIAELAHHLPSPDIQLTVAIDPFVLTEPAQREAMQRAAETFAHWNDDPALPLLAWEGIPEWALPATCLAVPAPHNEFVHVLPAATCLGAMKRIAGVFQGADRGKVAANSFNFIATDTTVPFVPEAEACTAYQHGGGQPPERHLWLKDDDRLVLYTTDTGDFGAAEIARVKDELSHLFVDCAPAGVLDDFIEGMRRASPDPACAACPNRQGCGHRFLVGDQPPYAAQEQWIADYVSALHGKVLDVGCGEQLYRDRLAPLLRDGVVRYTGLDPDEVSLERIRTALPQGRFHLGGIETFEGQPASYDFILSLRSLNHVLDIDEAMARMAALLKPGGQLLLVECIPFAMLRRAEQVAAADRAPRAGHQHFRNLASDQVMQFARRRSLQALQHQPASAQSTNQWVLLLGRPHPDHDQAGSGRPDLQ